MQADRQAIRCLAPRSFAGTADALRMCMIRFLAIAMVAFLVVCAIHWLADGDRRAARAMPAGERQELYVHVMSGMERFCRPAAIAPDGWCHQQAELLALLPECNDSCRTFISAYRSRATR